MIILRFVFIGVFINSVTADHFHGSYLEFKKNEPSESTKATNFLPNIFSPLPGRNAVNPLLDMKNNLDEAVEKMMKKEKTNKSSRWLPTYFKTTTPKLFKKTRTTEIYKHPVGNPASDLKKALDKLTTSIDPLSQIIMHTKQNTNNKEYLNDRNNYIYGKRSRRETKSDIEEHLTETNEKNSTINDANSNVSCADSIPSGRRSMRGPESMIKDKLLLYLEEGFRDIQGKVDLLERVKHRFSNVIPYRIGYIVANIDTLNVNTRNLREDVKRNKNLWGEREILDVYDRLKTSNSLVTNLMDTLKAFTDNNYTE